MGLRRQLTTRPRRCNPISVGGALSMVRIALLLIVVLSTVAITKGDERPPVIAAASDLKFALERIAARFEAESGQVVRLSFGSSGNFARQIRQGAPYALFLSADESFVFDLVEAGLTEGRGILYAVGRLVVFAPARAPFVPDAELAQLRAALERSAIRRFAIANPDHAPYGRAAREALQSLGLWESIESRLVLGENVSQAAQFAASSSADGGIFALSLALADVVGGKGTYALLPERLHGPLNQRMVLLRGAPPAARAFYAYLGSPPARAILAGYGFRLPVEGE